jgi:hypothetical protein
MTSNEVEKMDRDDALDSPTCPLTNPVMDQSELEGRPATRGCPFCRTAGSIPATGANLAVGR